MLTAGHPRENDVGRVVREQVIEQHLLPLRLAMSPSTYLALILSRPGLVLKHFVRNDFRRMREPTKNITTFAQDRLRPVDPTLEKRRTRASGSLRNLLTTKALFSKDIWPSIERALTP
jgi:hypothetical protein